MRLRAVGLFAGLAAFALLVARPARADQAHACSDAYVKAQNLRTARKLVDARAQLRICATKGCKGFIIKDCSGWLDEVEARMPSVVFAAKDATGQPLAAATVSVDGAVVASKLDGQSVDVDPGPHTFTFVTPDGGKLEKSVTVLEGQKAQLVSVAFAPHAPPPPVISPVAPEPVAVIVPTPPPPAPGFWTTKKEIAVVGAGVGVGGIVLGSVFGGLAGSAANAQKTDCPSPTSCTNHAGAVSEHSSAQTDAVVSTVGFIAGGALVAGGVILFLLDRHPSATATAVRVVPSLGPGSGGLWVTARF